MPHCADCESKEKRMDFFYTKRRKATVYRVGDIIRIDIIKRKENFEN
jgi:hypothetical protein